MRIGAVVVDREASAAADRRATEELGLPVAVLMENAGRGLAMVALEVALPKGIRTVAVVAGRGNNGGDGLVAARHLHALGVDVLVLPAHPAESYDATTECGRQMAVVRRLGIHVLEPSPGDWERRLPARSLLVDAVLGTGLRSPVRGACLDALRWLRGRPNPVVAADVPSGLDADSGALLGPVPRCVATVTFLGPKPGLLRGEGPALSGRVVVQGLGVAATALLRA